MGCVRKRYNRRHAVERIQLTMMFLLTGLFPFVTYVLLHSGAISGMNVPIPENDSGPKPAPSASANPPKVTPLLSTALPNVLYFYPSLKIWDATIASLNMPGTKEVPAAGIPELQKTCQELFDNVYLRYAGRPSTGIHWQMRWQIC